VARWPQSAAIYALGKPCDRLKSHMVRGIGLISVMVFPVDRQSPQLRKILAIAAKSLRCAGWFRESDNELYRYAFRAFMDAARMGQSSSPRRGFVARKLLYRAAILTRCGGWNSLSE